MMKTLDRYIIAIFLKNLLFCVFAMGALFAFQSMIAELYDHTYPTYQILFYHWLNFPQIIVQMSPPGVLLATVLTLSGLSRTQELVACYAIGYGLNRLMVLILAVVLLMGGLILLAEDRILPPVYRMRTTYYWREMKNHPDFFLDIRRDKIWYRSKNLIYNLQRFDVESKTIHGMSVYTFDSDFNLTRVVGAERASFTAESGWKLHDGTVTYFSQDSAFPKTETFQTKEIMIPETPEEFQEIDKEVDGLNFKQLNRYISRIKAAGADTRAYEVKLQSRISVAFIPIVMAFLAIPFSLGTRREGGLAKDLSLCLGITIIYWLSYSVSLSLGSKGVLLPVVAAWLPSFLFMLLALGLTAKKGR